ncbi:MAG: hypothetical protein HY902_00030 [Deltaproteobacteria bacterium]|nr:hypothetical protein [Deltaproteobacteria bacterium]
MAKHRPELPRFLATLALTAGCAAGVGCGAPLVDGPRAAALPPGPDRAVALRFQRYGPLLVKFGDGTVAPVSTWSDGHLTTRWRSSFAVRDFVGRGGQVCVITVDGAVGCAPNDRVQPLDVALDEPDARQVIVAPGEELCVLTGAGVVRCTRNTARLERQDAAEQMYQALGPVRRLFDHTACVIDHRDRLVCAGGREPEVLATDVVDAALTPNGPSATGCALRRDGTLLCWGGYSGEAGHGERSGGNVAKAVRGLPPIAKVSTGYGATCAIDRDAGVWCFGAHFGPDFVARPKGLPRCRQEKVLVHIPACPPTGPSGDNPCLRAGGSLRDRDIEQVREIHDRPCVSGGDEFVPWPTRLRLVPRARDVVISPTGGIFFLRDDGVVVTVDRADRAREATPPPGPTGK